MCSLGIRSRTRDIEQKLKVNSVKNNATIIDSFDEYIKPDLLEGDNKFDAGEYGFQDAEKARGSNKSFYL